MTTDYRLQTTAKYFCSKMTADYRLQTTAKYFCSKMTADYRSPTTAKYFRFERLEVWQLAREFVGEIYKITRKFPKDELFGLISQLRRAAISILFNIAEGSDRKSDVDFKRFLRMSITSLEETVSGLYVSLDQNFITREEFDKLYEDSHRLMAKLNALVSSLKR